MTMDPQDPQRQFLGLFIARRPPEAGRAIVKDREKPQAPPKKPEEK